MKLKVGIVGLLILLVVVLAMAQPRSILSREGYENTVIKPTNTDPDPLTIIVIIIIVVIFGPLALMLFR